MHRMMSIGERLEAIRRLGAIIEQQDEARYLTPALHQSAMRNPWFTSEFLLEAMRGISHIVRDLDDVEISQRYGSFKGGSKRIALLSAGNIPAVAFHDLLCIWISGHRAIVRLSQDDELLLPALQRELEDIEPRIKGMVEFTNDAVRDFDAVIATGSNNTARYFRYYFSKWPHIIRENRNGIALLTGNETEGQLMGLASDICMFFGLGCRNVSKLYIPEDYDFSNLISALEMAYGNLRLHQKYINNLDYQKAVMLISSIPFIEAGPVLLRQSDQIASPISLLHYAYYSDRLALLNEIEVRKGEIQCIVGDPALFSDALPLGSAQKPGFMDFADGVDVMDFLATL